MTQAWQARESQRQQLLETFNSQLLDLESEHGRKKFDFLLAKELVRFLEHSKLRIGDNGVEKDFLRMILADLSKFTNEIEERNVILSSLLTVVIESITGEFRSALLKLELSEPRKIFGTDSATEEVDY